MDWTSGYVSEIDYTHGYYRALAPELIDFSLLLAGYEPPRREGARYLELGYGQGLTLNVHAAAAPGEYWGTDFNPTHASNAQTLAKASGADARLFDDGFADLGRRGDLPMFDYIVLHGVWSWVSDDNRRKITDILRDHLKVGGAVYISYNALPGWASAMPLRHLMATHMEAAGNLAQGLISRIDAAIGFGRSLAESDARYFTANPTAKSRLDMIAGQNRNYLAHEFFNRDWSPMHFSEVHRWLSEAKLGYAAAASPLEQLDAFNMTAAQQKLLSGIGYDVLRETVRDYVLNRQFRADLYTRGARRLTPLERSERWNEVRVVLTKPAEAIPMEAQTSRGKVTLKEELYRPVIDVLADGGGAPQRLADLADRPELSHLPPGGLFEIVAALVGADYASPAQTDAAIEAAKPACARLNAHLVGRAKLSNEVAYLASPVIGGGVQVSRFEQMFLDARARGKKTPDDWARDAWQVLAKQNQSIIKNGVVLKTPDENLEELSAYAKALAERALPLYQRLGVVD
jgi:SAM-dependent methyltransferase